MHATTDGERCKIWESERRGHSEQRTVFTERLAPHNWIAWMHWGAAWSYFGTIWKRTHGETLLNPLWKSFRESTKKCRWKRVVDLGYDPVFGNRIRRHWAMCCNLIGLRLKAKNQERDFLKINKWNTKHCDQIILY